MTITTINRYVGYICVYSISIMSVCMQAESFKKQSAHENGQIAVKTETAKKQNSQVELSTEFVIPKKPVRRKRMSRSQLKQELGESLIDLIKAESKQIELAAQVQQSLYNRVEELLENKKNCFFAQATHEQLKQSLHRIQQETIAAEHAIQREKDRLQFVRQGCTKTIKNR